MVTKDIPELAINRRMCHCAKGGHAIGSVNCPVHGNRPKKNNAYLGKNMLDITDDEFGSHTQYWLALLESILDNEERKNEIIDRMVGWGERHGYL